MTGTPELPLDEKLRYLGEQFFRQAADKGLKQDEKIATLTALAQKLTALNGEIAPDTKLRAEFEQRLTQTALILPQNEAFAGVRDALKLQAA